MATTNKPIVFDLRSGTASDPFLPYYNIPYLINGGRVQLAELPDQNYKVKVSQVSPLITYSETTNEFPSSLQYVVNYSTGDVHFNPSEEGKTLSFTWYGRGVTLIPASRIVTKELDGNPIETLQDIIDGGSGGGGGDPLDSDILVNFMNSMVGADVYPVPSTANGVVLTTDKNAIFSEDGSIIYL